MAIETVDNITVGTAWTPIASGVANVFASLLRGGEVLIAIGSTPPPADSTRGHIVRSMPGRDTFTSSGVLTTETVYARTRADTAVLAISRG